MGPGAERIGGSPPRRPHGGRLPCRVRAAPDTDRVPTAEPRWDSGQAAGTAATAAAVPVPAVPVPTVSVPAVPAARRPPVPTPLCPAVPAGLAGMRPPHLLPLPQPDQPQLRRRHPGSGRRAAVSRGMARVRGGGVVVTPAPRMLGKGWVQLCPHPRR